MIKEITIIGGAGHVGLAFALICTSKKIKVHIHDINKESLRLIKRGVMPHKEKNGANYLKKAIKNNLLTFSSKFEDIKLNKINVVCLGTPIDEFLNPQYNILIDIVKKLIKHLKNDYHLIIRSTVFPGTTRFLHQLLENNKKNIKMSFFPERFVQGLALEEFNKFPHLIGSINKKSENECKNFLSIFSKDIITMKPEEAEITKLFLNSYRYIQFSIANQFYKIADTADLNYKKIDHAMKYKYKRGNIPSPGFAAGPCLFKDTMQLSAFSHDNFSLGMEAMSTNEGLVNYLVDKIKNKHNLSKITVGILGMSFKAESDDIRNSLSYKFKKVLSIHAKKVLTSDPYVKNDKDIKSLDYVKNKSDILIIATPHNIYKKIKTKKTIYNVWVDF
tara:strand:+ start:3273 stop:4439 length:1167 start_codon:yes stop_codon:yes gene_type:complete